MTSKPTQLLQPTTSIHLRDIVPADLPTRFQFQLDPESNSLAAVIPRDHDSFMKLWPTILTDPTITAKAIIADDLLVGHISCFKLDGLDAVGYWLSKTYWNRGIATRALTLFLDLIQTRPLYARVARHNAASLRVLQRCGFMIDGYQHSPADARYLECEEVLLSLPGAPDVRITC